MASTAVRKGNSALVGKLLVGATSCTDRLVKQPAHGRGMSF